MVLRIVNCTNFHHLIALIWQHKSRKKFRGSLRSPLEWPVHSWVPDYARVSFFFESWIRPCTSRSRKARIGNIMDRAFFIRENRLYTPWKSSKYPWKSLEKPLKNIFGFWYTPCPRQVLTWAMPENRVNQRVLEYDMNMMQEGLIKIDEGLKDDYGTVMCDNSGL